MEAIWRKTFSGDLLFLREQGLEVAHLPGGERAEAISLWEGIAGYPPRGRLAFWRWKRGLKRIQRDIGKILERPAGAVGEDRS